MSPENGRRSHGSLDIDPGQACIGAVWETVGSTTNREVRWRRYAPSGLHIVRDPRPPAAHIRHRCGRIAAQAHCHFLWLVLLLVIARRPAVRRGQGAMLETCG